MVDNITVESAEESLASIAGARVLIVDDTLLSRTVLQEILKKEGFASITAAENGVDAFEKLENANPDIILLDIMMPEMDGIVFCKKLRGIEQWQHVPVIVQSGSEEESKITEAFDVGATDYVHKPINPVELMARLKVHLQNRFMMQRLVHYHKRVERELNSARLMQESILPDQKTIDAITEEYGVSIASAFKPSSELGGDFWGIQKVSYSELALYMVDFSGHGVQAALNTFRLHTLLTGEDVISQNPSATLRQINKRLCALLKAGQFATMFYGVLNTDTHRLEYGMAGAPSPFLAGEKVELLEGSGLPLGVDAAASYDTYSHSLVPGDKIVVYSDALVESLDLQGEVLGEQEFLTLLQQNRQSGAEKTLKSILNRFRSHVKGVPLDDDLTLAVIKVA